MVERGANNRELELKEAIMKSLDDIPEIIDELDGSLGKTAAALRIGQDEEVFGRLSQGLDGLKYLVQYIGELTNGLKHLEGCGQEVPVDSISCWERSAGLFKEMLACFESEDWVSVSDMIEYEIRPLLKEGRQGLVAVRDGLDNRCEP